MHVKTRRESKLCAKLSQTGHPPRRRPKSSFGYGLPRRLCLSVLRTCARQPSATSCWKTPTRPPKRCSPSRWTSSCRRQSGRPSARHSIRRRTPSPHSRNCSPKRASSMDKEKPPLNNPIPLAARHDLSAFDCGVPALNNYLKKLALQNQRSQSARTYVATRGECVV